MQLSRCRWVVRMYHSKAWSALSMRDFGFPENSLSECTEESSSSLVGFSPDYYGDSDSGSSPGSSASTDSEYCDPRPLMGLLESDESREETQEPCDYSDSQ